MFIIAHAHFGISFAWTFMLTLHQKYPFYGSTFNISIVRGLSPTLHQTYTLYYIIAHTALNNYFTWILFGLAKAKL